MPQKPPSLSLTNIAVAVLLALPTTLWGQDATWGTKAPLPLAVAEVGVAAICNIVYVVGGTRQAGQAEPVWATTQTLAYDAATDTWQERAALPRALTHVAVAELDGTLYAIGGFTGIVHMGPQNYAIAYDPKADEWREIAPLPQPLGSVALAAIGGRLHVFGGRDSADVVKLPMPEGAPELFAGMGTVDTHQMYDPATNSWSAGKPLPGGARDHAGIAVLNEKIHIFGGRTEDTDDNLARHDVYDPVADTWSVAAPLETARSAGAVAVLEGRIVYAGGECKPGGAPFTPNAYEDVTSYDPQADTWTPLASLPQARHAFGAATVGDTIYFVGGAPVCGGGALTDMLTLRLE